MAKKLRRVPARVKQPEQTAPQEQPRRTAPPLREQDRYRVATTDWTGDLMWVSLEAAEKIDKENEEMWRKLLNGELDTEAMYQEELERRKAVRARYAAECRAKGKPEDPDYPWTIGPEEEARIRRAWDEKMETAWQLAEENLEASED